MCTFYTNLKSKTDSPLKIRHFLGVLGRRFLLLLQKKLVESCSPIPYHLGRAQIWSFYSPLMIVKPIKPPTEAFKSERNNQVGELIDSYSVNFTFLEDC